MTAMSGKIFLDSNVLIYAATGREDSPVKFRRAEEIVEREEICLSTQVIGEFIHNVQNAKKMKRPLTPAETAKWVDKLFEFPLVSIDRAIIETAMLVQQRYQIGYWDGQILAAAESIGAEILYSEELNHGQAYGSVRCQNPFRTQ
jgi:predicted nucleic acid-binding protein